MIEFDRDGVRFVHRAVAVMTDGARVLLHRAICDDFWAMPGGHVEMGEATPATLRREMREELSVEVTVGRLLWVIENFFLYNGIRHHELGLYFHTQLPPDSPLLRQETFDGDEQGLRLIFRWFALRELADITLYPEFLKIGLRRLPDAPCHVVVQETPPL